VDGWVAGGRGQAGAGGLWDKAVEEQKLRSPGRNHNHIRNSGPARTQAAAAASEARPSQQDTHARLEA
jgi:hypothetical protein